MLFLYSRLFTHTKHRIKRIHFENAASTPFHSKLARILLLLIHIINAEKDINLGLRNWL